MSFLNGLFRSRDKPVENRTSGSSWNFHIGRSTSGKNVNQLTSMQVSAVNACVRILAESVAQLPLYLYKLDEDGSKIKATDNPLYFLLHDEPNPEMTSFSFRETLMVHLLLWGNAYAQIIRNGKGEVIALYPLMPNRMEVSRDEKGVLYYSYTTSADDPQTNKGSIVKLSSYDVLQIPGLGFDGLVGYSPIAMARNAIGASIATEEYGARFFEHGANPSGILKHPGVIKDPAKIRDSWNAAFAGSNNAGKVAVLEEGMEYTPVSLPPGDAQFIESRKFAIEEIARIFRVPLHLIGSLEHATFSNIEQQSLEYTLYTLDPWVRRWEQSMHRALIRMDDKDRYVIKFNVDGLLRGDYQSRMNGYATAIQNGFMSVNDVRRVEGLDLLPDEEGGNLYLINGAMTKLKDAGAFANSSIKTNDDDIDESKETEEKEEEDDGEVLENKEQSGNRRKNTLP